MKKNELDYLFCATCFFKSKKIILEKQVVVIFLQTSVKYDLDLDLDFRSIYLSVININIQYIVCTITTGADLIILIFSL